MARRPALLVTATLTTTTALTLVAAGSLGMLEDPLRDIPVLAWLAPDDPVSEPDAFAGADIVAPDPTPRTGPGAASGPAPVVATAAPVALRIDTLDVSAPLVPVGVLADGAMEIPDDVGTVGWYATSWRRVSPGDPGVAVLAGHRDSRSQGAGALHDVSELVPGDIVHVVHVDGRVSAWRVDELLETRREELPGELLFATDGPPRIALVSCGGEFDTTIRSYTHNTIVLASEVRAADGR
jgi:hypothetical protein